MVIIMRKPLFYLSIQVLAGLAMAALILRSAENPGIKTFFAITDLQSATMADVHRVLGEPAKYRWGDKTYRRPDLPETYVMEYQGGFSILVSHGKMTEFRVEGPGIPTKSGVEVGQGEEALWRLIPKPSRVLYGGNVANGLEPNVLYQDLGGQKGHTYVSDDTRGIRAFTINGKISQLYFIRREDPSVGLQGPFLDVRGMDLSKSDPVQLSDNLETLCFNLDTLWPEKLATKPGSILESGKDPGLAVRRLQSKGLTGKGVRVAVIDQAMNRDHPEYAGRIQSYRDFGCTEIPSMHGPAVASIVVGKTVGVAPDAELVFAAVDMSRLDATPLAKALDWILETNAGMPPGKRVKVVSVSACPSGPHSKFRNGDLWETAVSRAEREGILVLDCTTIRHRVASAHWMGNRQQPAALEAGTANGSSHGWLGWELFAPASGRTLAEELSSGGNGYQYDGRGGQSWAVPYVAGILALGQQVAPEMSPFSLWELIKATGDSHGGHLYVSPEAFLEGVLKKTKGSAKGGRYRLCHISPY